MQRNNQFWSLALAAALSAAACDVGVVDEDLPPTGDLILEGELSEEEFFEQLGDENEEDDYSVTLRSIHGCTLRPYAPFGHAGNLHVKGDLRCDRDLGATFHVYTHLQIWISGFFYTYGDTFGPGHYRTRIQVGRNGVVQRTAYTSFVWRQPN